MNIFITLCSEENEKIKRRLFRLFGRRERVVQFDHVRFELVGHENAVLVEIVGNRLFQRQSSLLLVNSHFED